MGINSVIHNVGEAVENTVNWSIFVKGVILGLIDIKTEGQIDVLVPNDKMPIQTDKNIFGFGYTEVIIIADDANQVKNAIIIGPFIIFN